MLPRRASPTVRNRCDYRRAMLIAEDLVLLLTDDASGHRSTDSTTFSYVLAGAVLLELAMIGRVDVAGRGETVKRDRLVLRDDSPTDDAILDAGLSRLARLEGRKPRDVIGKLSKGLSDDLYARLVERGILRPEESKVLGLVPRRRWPAVDIAHEAAIRTQIRQSIDLREPLEPRIAALVSLLSAVDQVPAVVGSGEGLSKREIRKRGKQVAAQAWAPQAVREAVEAVNAAVIAGVVAATSAAAVGSS